MNTPGQCPRCNRVTPGPPVAGLCPNCVPMEEALTQADPDVTQIDRTPPRRRMPEPGDAFGEYRIVSQLGRGGMGHVYEAIHERTGRRMALKVMSHALTSDEDRARFLREGQLAASIHHPNIVHIHSCEETEGAPVIAMEFIDGGTLTERIRSQGPFAVTAATELVLQLIDGLEAAAARGILHRDIKPSNCFLQSDGTLKIGDFGLSISTFRPVEAPKPPSGSILGTPAYASPEQLRSEVTDVRSDIYSVGATVFQLLTGRAPFGGKDIPSIVAAVLNLPPPQPQALRPDLPAELARVVLQCLAKDRKDRFESYEALRHALLPFRDSTPVLARPTMRFLADLADNLMTYLPAIPFVIVHGTHPNDGFLSQRTIGSAVLPLVLLVWRIGYYTLLEGRYGAGVGKWLGGLRVVGTDGQPPGIPRAFARSLLFAIPYALPVVIVALLFSAGAQDQVLPNILKDWLWIPILALLFLPCRHRDRSIAFHDQWTRTRVIVRPTTQPRPVLRPKELLKVPKQRGASTASRKPEAFGPFTPKALLYSHAAEELWLALDPVLEREVWVHRRKGPSGAVAGIQPEVNRPSRLRWLQSDVDRDGAWDAFQAPSGAAFLAVTRRAKQWAAVRFWLQDLVLEMEPRHGKSTSPLAVSLQRLWITQGGRLMLLDFDAPGVSTEEVSQSQPLETGMDDFMKALQTLLHTVARRSLEGRRRCLQPNEGPAAAAVPLQARGFLETISRGGFETWDQIAGNLASLVELPALLSRRRRAATLFLLPGLLLFLGVVTSLVLGLQDMREKAAWAEAFPNRTSLPTLWRMRTLEVITPEGGAAEKVPIKLLVDAYIARHYGHLATNSTLWKDPRFHDSLREISPREFMEAQDKGSAAPVSTQERAELFVPVRAEAFQRASGLLPVTLPVAFILAGSPLIALVELGGILLWRTSPILQLFGIAIVTRRGAFAGRWRQLGRWVVGWGGFIGLMIYTGWLVALLISQWFTEPALGFAISNTSPPDAASLARVGGCLALFLAGILTAIQTPMGGLLDRCFGTRLVLRG